MNRRGLLSALALVLTVSAPAFADTATRHAGDYGNTSWYGQSTRTRAELRAELEAARRSSTVDAMPHAYRPTLEGGQLGGGGR